MKDENGFRVHISLILGALFVLAFASGCQKKSCVALPTWDRPIHQDVAVLAGDVLHVSGRIDPSVRGVTNACAGILMFRYYDALDQEIRDKKSPYSSKCKSGYEYLNTGKFSVELTVPPKAVRAELMLARWTTKVTCRLDVVGFRHAVRSGGTKSHWQMSIVSVWFLLFVGVCFMLYFCSPRSFRPWILLASSLIFYSFFKFSAFAFILGSALSIWIGALVLERGPKGRSIISLLVVFNVGLLAVAKYLKPAMLGCCDYFDYVEPSFSLVLPLGISFYTLQAISYVVDVYRKTIPAERNLAKLLLYLTFFPTIMQGPISRYGQLGPQLWTPHPFDWERMHSGFSLALWGFFKKMVIADRAAMLVDSVFASGSEIEGFAAALGVLCYAIQIYADFSGCVDICRGISEVLGIDLVENFKHPYFSTSIKDFWRRWHISLSSWLKDYVYIPLGGNRHGSFRKYLNVLIVFGVSGIWHGVGLNFFIWGLLHGLYQVLDGLTSGLRTKALAFCQVDPMTFSFRFGQRLWTFVLVAFAWIFFRASTCADAWSVIRRMFVWNPWTWTDGSYLKYGLDAKDLDVLVISMVVLIVVSILQERGSVRQMLRKQTLWFRWTIYLLGVFATLIFGIYGPGYNAAQFIYMQF